jgi:hypothetical protein
MLRTELFVRVRFHLYRVLADCSGCFALHTALVYDIPAAVALTVYVVLCEIVL